jgi:ABC-type proline/glycine betaine transport system permease subunit
MSEFLPLGEWVDRGVKLLIENDAGSLQQLGAAIEGLTESLEAGLLALPVWLVAAVFVLTGLWRVGWKFALFCVGCCAVIAGTGFWPQTMVTLALITVGHAAEPADRPAAGPVDGKKRPCGRAWCARHWTSCRPCRPSST